MLLKSVKLNNIRSYTGQKVEFPSGSLMLSGDIGSGKSTVLLAIEFALFGSKPSELPASSLLRHGKKEGFVELRFELDGREIIIKRNLKRGKQGIKQETGYVIYNGSKKELSPVEMKSTMFEMLGYPKDLVSKGKDLIYRYTVYTPQEEMKRILMEDKDTRLNTLRKVFNIDKYKRIRENSAVFIRSLKEKKREIEGFISDLSEKKKELEDIENEIKSLSKKIRVILPRAEKALENLKEKKEKISVFEKKVEDLIKLRNSLKVFGAELDSMISQRQANNDTISRLEKQIKVLGTELSKESIKSNNITEKIKKVNTNIRELNNEIDGIMKKLNEHVIVKAKAEELISKVIVIEKCPMCLQNVEHAHKASISERERKNIEEASRNISEISAKEKDLKVKLSAFEEEKEQLVKLESKAEIIKLKMQNLKDKQEEKEKLEKTQLQIKRKVGLINTKKIETNEKIESMKDVEEGYKTAKREVDDAMDEERKINLERVRLESEKESLERSMKSIKRDIEKKISAKEKLNYLSQTQNWLESFFVNLMGTMEKHVMLKVHREFNELFKEWFNILIEEEAISVRLDDEFTPIIEQSGYDTAIENLSGGEKTAVALSYRLALNKVINDVVSGIKTKDILMLDEPTDGFSSEQLDKVRDILEQLKMRQIVIVSHEPKIESFVDNVIRIGKHEHVSSVV